MPKSYDRILRRAPRNLLSGASIVRALALAGRRYACRSCGGTMFVRYESGLCPHCYNDQLEVHDLVDEWVPELSPVGEHGTHLQR